MKLSRKGQVRDRIILIRDLLVEASPEFHDDYQLAGPVRFDVALGPGW